MDTDNDKEIHIPMNNNDDADNDNLAYMIYTLKSGKNDLPPDFVTKS